MKNLSVMLKPASSACNMRCRYCFYADVSRSREQYSYGRMSTETAEAILNNVFSSLDRGDRLCLSFQGGEPTLAGLPFFQDFVEMAEQLRRERGVVLSFALQTNGLLLDEAWCAFLKEHAFLVGLSLDISAELHDRNRVDAEEKGTYKRVLRAKRLLEQHQIDYNILAVLTNEMARHPKQVWDFVEKENITYLQLIPCLGELDDPAPGPYTLTPERFASFYTQLFRYWVDAYRQGRYRSIKLFDDLVSLLSYGMRNACGITGECSPQVVVEADGSVYPCDFYVTDAWRVGNLAQQSLEELFASEIPKQFCLRSHTRPQLCETCPYRSLCGGGCKRMQREVCCAPEDTSCGYRTLLDNILPALQRIALEIKRR